MTVLFWIGAIGAICLAVAIFCFFGAVATSNRYSEKALADTSFLLAFIGLVLVALALLGQWAWPSSVSKTAADSRFMGGPSACMREGDSPRRVSGGLAHHCSEVRA